jgi:hypothetical protein
MRYFCRVVLLLALAIPAWSATKVHVVALGKTQSVRILVGPEEASTLSINVRPLYIDDKMKEFTTGSAHDVTDRLFVVQRAYRVNDSLPGDSPKQSKWIWQRGGWLLVDRISGHITQLKLPDFDPGTSQVSWYRDYAAYCGVSDSGERWYAEVAQIGVRKAVFRRELGRGAASPETCSSAAWERRPPRVTLSPATGDKFTVNVRTRQAEEPADNAAEQ